MDGAFLPCSAVSLIPAGKPRHGEGRGRGRGGPGGGGGLRVAPRGPLGGRRAARWPRLAAGMGSGQPCAGRAGRQHGVNGSRGCVVRDGAPQSTARCAGPRRCSRVRGVRRAFRAGSRGCFLRGERNPFPPPHLGFLRLACCPTPSPGAELPFFCPNLPATRAAAADGCLDCSGSGFSAGPCSCLLPGTDKGP